MNTIILLVTWIIYNQPPSSYQVSFNSMDTCNAARKSLFQEAARLKAEENKRTAEIRSQPGIVAYNPTPAPMVTAVCVTH